MKMNSIEMMDKFEDMMKKQDNLAKYNAWR